MLRPIVPLVVALLAIPAAEARAQEPPKVQTAAYVTVNVPAYKARFIVGASAKSERAKDASAKAASALNAVRDALIRFGIDRESMPSAGYSVGREELADGTRQTRSYLASSSLTVEVVNLERLGAAVDAALSAGATEVDSITFLPRDADAARTEAIALAFRRAKRDAESLAEASGVRLGRLLLLTTAQGLGGATIETQTVARQGAIVPATDIPAPTVAVSAGVRAEWLLDTVPDTRR